MTEIEIKNLDNWRRPQFKDVKDGEWFLFSQEIYVKVSADPHNTQYNAFSIKKGCLERIQEDCRIQPVKKVNLHWKIH